MIRYDPFHDRALRDLLRRFDSGAPLLSHDRDMLKRRILRAADPVLEARAGRERAWWQVTAGWARTLIPLGLVTAMAAAGCMALAAHADRGRGLVRLLAAQDSLVGSVRGDHTSQHLLDYLVTPGVPDRR